MAMGCLSDILLLLFELQRVWRRYFSDLRALDGFSRSRVVLQTVVRGAVESYGLSQ